MEYENIFYRIFITYIIYRMNFFFFFFVKRIAVKVKILYD